MNDELRTFVLLVDAAPSNSNHKEALVHHNAAISFTRIVRSRGHRLIVQADWATSIAIMFASSEYHQSSRVETNERATTQFLCIFPPLESSNNRRFAESNWMQSTPENKVRKDFEFERTCLDDLGDWANAVSDNLDSQKRQFQFESQDFTRLLDQYRPTLIVVLGETGSFSERLFSAAKFAAKAPGFRSFFDVPKQLDVPSKLGFGNDLSIESVLDSEEQNFDWTAKREAVLERDDATQREISQAIREAKLHVALEKLVDGQ